MSSRVQLSNATIVVSKFSLAPVTVVARKEGPAAGAVGLLSAHPEGRSDSQDGQAECGVAHDDSG